MAKLRKLLEDVHTESEQQVHQLRTKHQTAMMELQESIERISRCANFFLVAKLLYNYYCPSVSLYVRLYVCMLGLVGSVIFSAPN